jgi:UDP-N-acetylglucosamine 2-epimerase
MKLLSIVGARPQFVKIAPIVREVERRRSAGDGQIEHLFLHTGQHYDAAMSDVFFAELDLPEAQINLAIGSGSHGKQTGAMLAGIEEVLLDVKPDAVVVYGDTNSTIAGALAAAKLHVRVAHVEAGLRSFKRTMPEEINRIAADHICDLLLAPTLTAMRNLNAEGLAGRSVLCGDIMYDAVLQYRDLAAQRATKGGSLGLEGREFGVVTVHRAENTDDESRLRTLLSVFEEIAESGLHLVFPVHPRTLQRIRSSIPGWAPHSRLIVTEPLGYLDMLWLLDHASLALTDSGGLQKEAFFLGCPCVTLRDETEWVETVELGGNILAGTDAGKILQAVRAWMSRRRNGNVEFSHGDAFGRADTARRVLEAVIGLARTRG